VMNLKKLWHNLGSEIYQIVTKRLQNKLPIVTKRLQLICTLTSISQKVPTDGLTLHSLTKLKKPSVR